MLGLSVRRLVAISAVALLGVACAPAQGEDARGGATAILRGEPDAAHDAVVLVSTSKTLCSGTIFKKDVAARIGWVVTAAHCVTPERPNTVLLTRDWREPGSKRFGVIDSTHHPGYVSDGDIVDDFAVIRILGIDETTPVIPLAVDDEFLAVNSTVSSVGFGTTNPNPSLGLRNTKRNLVWKTIAKLSEDLIEYDQKDASGICSGDSGGPVIAGKGTDERIVGVHSYVGRASEPEICAGISASGRVTSELAFFDGETSKPVPEPDSCAYCGAAADIATTGACPAARARCLSEPDCFGYNRCLAKGGTADDCFHQYPLGEASFRAYSNCRCTQVRETCAPGCASDPLRCRDVPRCGVTMADTSCNTCLESSCCQELSACTADGQCFACLRGNDADPACAENALRTAAAACMATNCKAACRPIPQDNAESSDDPSKKLTPSNSSDRLTLRDIEEPTGIRWTERTGCSTSGSGAPSSAAWVGVALAASMVAARRRRSS